MAAGWFAAERPADSRYRSTAADALRAPYGRRRRSAANAGSVMSRAEKGGSAQQRLVSYPSAVFSSNVVIVAVRVSLRMNAHYA